MGQWKKITRRLRDGTLRDIVRETGWIYHHTRAYRRAVLSFTLLGLLATVLSLFSSLLSKELVNAIVATKGWLVLRNGLLVVLLSTSGIVLNALTTRYGAKITLRVSNELRAEVYGIIMNTDWESLQQFHSGDLLNRINTDVTTISGSVLGWVPTLIIKLSQLLASLAVILFYDPAMALLSLLSAPLTLAVAKPFLNKMRALSQNMRTVSSEMMSFHEETLQNVQSIKAFGLVDTFRNKLAQVQKVYYDASMEYNRFSVANSALLSVVGSIVGYLCLGWGAFRLWEERIDFGTMVLFIQLAGYLSSSLTALIKLVPSAVECTVAAQRIMTIFDLPREEAGNVAQARALREKPFLLCVDGLEFSYQTRSLILEDLTLKIPAGDMVAIVGASGSGKTTLFRILLGLLQPTKGRMELIAGAERVPISPATRCLFSYVPQDNVIFSGTVADTLRLVRPEATEDELYAALRVACAEDFIRALPQGLQTSLKERGSSLSIGQNQRLAIARAVLADAPILLLDEVTSALDLETEEQVLKNIAALPNKTCIISTHRPSVLSLCNQIYRIRDHRLETVQQRTAEPPQ